MDPKKLPSDQPVSPEPTKPHVANLGYPQGDPVPQAGYYRGHLGYPRAYPMPASVSPGNGSGAVPVAVPSSASAPVQLAAPMAASAPIHLAKPEAESAPVHLAAPAPESAPVHLAKPEAESAPVHLAKPDAESAPVHLAAPAPESAPVHLVAPAPESSPVHLAAPAPESAPVHLAAPAPESAPVHLAAPSVSSAPVHLAAQTAITAPVKVVGQTTVTAPVRFGTAPVNSNPTPLRPSTRLTSSAISLDKSGNDAEIAAIEEVEPEESEVYFPPDSHIDLPRRANPLVRAWRKVGGGPLALSIAIHAGILILGASIVISTQMIQKQVDFLPGGGSQQGAAASAEMQHKVQQKKRSTLNKKTAMQKLTVAGNSSSVTLPDAPPDMLDLPDMGSMMGGGSLAPSGGFSTSKSGAGGGFGAGVGLGAAASFVNLPPSMRSRCSTQERLEKLRQNGGTSECERAVSQSLEWLKTQQNADGSWGRNNKAAMTGLALLCYLGRCETPDSLFYGDNVLRGIMYLVELSKKNPHGILSETPMENQATYEHGIATYALGEMYTLARLGGKPLPGMREAFEKGVTLIIENQTSRGSWNYNGKQAGKPYGYNKDSNGEDLSLAGWQFQAIKAAKNSGLKINGLHKAIDKCTDYILSKQTKDGGFGVPEREAHYNQYSLTGAGALALQTMSKGKTASIKKAIGFLRRFLTDEPLEWDKNCNLYCWYYYTQTFFQAGGDDWKFYNEQFLPQILANQNPDGSFKKGRPNWTIADAADPIYRQTLCTLQLEVYYRYLKVADREEESFFEK